MEPMRCPSCNQVVYNGGTGKEKQTCPHCGVEMTGPNEGSKIEEKVPLADLAAEERARIDWLAENFDEEPA